VELAGDSGAPNVILGAPVNFVAASAVGSTIAGGGATNYYGLAYTNSIWASYGAIGGGLANRIAPGALWSTIGGGDNNNIADISGGSTIGGGYYSASRHDEASKPGASQPAISLRAS
jgi:hypothetical protein